MMQWGPPGADPDTKSESARRMKLRVDRPCSFPHGPDDDEPGGFGKFIMPFGIRLLRCGRRPGLPYPFDHTSRFRQRVDHVGQGPSIIPRFSRTPLILNEYLLE
jgi:hypothetical protein